MTREELKPFYGKQVKVACNDGTVVVGFFCTFTYGEDNENGIPSIVIEREQSDIEIYVNDIKDIKTA
jgi:hypothetical protein